METIDLAKSDKTYYSARRQPEIRAFGPLPYLTLNGQGDPNGEDFAAAVQAMYGTAYGVRALYKAEGVVFKVPKLEGLWWVEAEGNPLQVPREEWHWKLLIRMPEVVRGERVEEARATVFRKKGMPKVREVAFETLDEGLCVQVMHVGPYADEPATLEKLHGFIEQQGLTPVGNHHEIYISDPRKSKPEAMKTILRMPVRRES